MGEIYGRMGGICREEGKGVERRGACTDLETWMPGVGRLEEAAIRDPSLTRWGKSELGEGGLCFNIELDPNNVYFVSCYSSTH